jgi:halocyanin-like protein
MSDRSEDVSRRGFLMATAGGAAAAGVAGTAAGQETTQMGGTGTANGTAANGTETNGTSAPEGTEGGGSGGGGGGGGEPDFGGHLGEANLYDGSVADMTGQSTVTVKVGAGDEGYAFDPPAVKVDNGATVEFEWTGNGGAHNVVSSGDGPLDSGSPAGGTGVMYEHTFEEDGVYNYICVPHESLGMLGSVVVGTDYATVEQESGGGGGPALPGSAKTIGVATALVMSASLGLSYIFMKYGGDYETPE